MAIVTRPADKNKHPTGQLIFEVLWTCVKIFIIPVLCIAALIFGLAIGYSVLGDQPLSDVFDFNTWKHMYDLVFAAGS